MRSCGAMVFFMTLAPALCLLNTSTGFIQNPEDGRRYRLMYYAQPWSRARDACVDIGAKLAVPKSEAQFAFLQRMVRRMHYPSIVGSRYKLLVWLGINNVENYQIWKNIDGENIEDTGYHTWAGSINGMPGGSPRDPHCVGMDAMNMGLRSWWCHLKQPYICEMPPSQTMS